MVRTKKIKKQKQDLAIKKCTKAQGLIQRAKTHGIVSKAHACARVGTLIRVKSPKMFILISKIVLAFQNVYVS